VSYLDSTSFPGSIRWQGQYCGVEDFSMSDPEAKKAHEPDRASAWKPFPFHGVALARDLWAEQYGPWVVLGFSTAFALILIALVLLGQVPGKSLALKGLSDTIQLIGEGIGLIFCARIALRLRTVTIRLKQDLAQKESGPHTPNDLVVARSELQSAHRAFLAWLLLTMAIACYASGQAGWTSYDARMSAADVPFPGFYDIGFVMSYPFFLLGTLLLTRRSKASVGYVRLLLDALGVMGTALTLSWFFLLSPLLAGLAQQPSFGAAFLSIYFPTGDLFLVAVGAFLMFSPLANRAQQPVFLCLCLGLIFLALSDSLLAYYSLSSSFKTGTLQDVLWPLSMLLLGLAAIEYPRSVAREQEQATRARNLTLRAASRPSQIITTMQTLAPFILILITCTVLLTVVAPRGGGVLIQADGAALVLILIMIVRQALTLLENTRLTLQMRGELVISRRELQLTRREADEATRAAQEKHVLEEGIATLREIHAQVARGDFRARAPSVPGPLLPIAVSLNLMLDRLSSLSQRGVAYQQLVRESQVLQAAVERLSQGLPAWLPNQPPPQSQTELGPILLGLVHLQRFQEGQWRRLSSTVEAMGKLIRRLQESTDEVRRSPLFEEGGQARFERMILDRVAREVGLLDRQQRDLLNQTLLIAHPEAPSDPPAIPGVPATPSDPSPQQKHAPRPSSRMISSREQALWQGTGNSRSQRERQGE